MTDGDQAWMGKNAGLTVDEISAFLERGVVARIATVRPDGWPYVAPLWQEWDGTSFWLVPRARSRFVDYLRHEPRVCISVALESAPYTRVTALGRAEIVEGPVDGQGGASRWVPVARRMARRYLGEHGPEYLEPTLDRPRYLIRVLPVKLTTWEGVEWHQKYTSP